MYSNGSFTLEFAYCRSLQFSSCVVNEPICCLAAGHEGVNNPIVLARLSDEVLALSVPGFYSGKVYGE